MILLSKAWFLIALFILTPTSHDAGAVPTDDTIVPADVSAPEVAGSNLWNDVRQRQAGLTR